LAARQTVAKRNDAGREKFFDAIMNGGVLSGDGFWLVSLSVLLDDEYASDLAKDPCGEVCRVYVSLARVHICSMKLSVMPAM
jgi:hypothetical protein